MILKFAKIFILSFALHYLISIGLLELILNKTYPETDWQSNVIWVIFFILNFPIFLMTKGSDFILLEKEFITFQLIPFCSSIYGIFFGIIVIFAYKSNKLKPPIKIKKGFE